MGDFFEFADDWPELAAVIFLFLGFILALASSTFTIAYIVIFLLGLMFGRTWYRFHRARKTALVMSIAACLLGFGFGAILGNLQLVVLVFLLGILIGYWVHQKGWISSVEL